MPARSRLHLVILCALMTMPFGADNAGAAATSYNAAAKDAYRKIFLQVLQKYIAAAPGPNLCLPPLFGFGDVVNETADVFADLDAPATGVGPGGSRAAQFKALEAAGLVTSAESTRMLAGKSQRVLTYRRTPKAMAISQGPSICYARGELDQLVKWKGPVVLGEYQAAFVYYKVKTGHIEDWARSPDVLAAFPTIVPVVNGEPAKLRQTVIDLSSEGWDIAEYARYLQLQ